MFKTLVVALDHAPDGDRALRVAQALMRMGPVKVELVTVSSPAIPTSADAYELQRRADRFGWGPDSWSVVHADAPAEALLARTAHAEDALLVMAASARPPWASSIFGSTTRDVLRQTDRPVLLIGPHVGWTYQPPCTTLVPCIGAGDVIERAVRAVVAWQQTFNSPAPQLTEVVAPGVEPTAAERRLRTVGELLAAQHVHADRRIVRDDDPVSGLEILTSRFAGPVYVATSSRSTDGHVHWHSTTQQLIRRSVCPVLIVPARPMSLPQRRTDRERLVRMPFLDSTVPATSTPS